MTTLSDLQEAIYTLFRAFDYLQPRMKGGGIAPPMPMNAEALAGSILHNCMAKVLREIQQLRESAPLGGMISQSSGWISDRQAG